MGKTRGSRLGANLPAVTESLRDYKEAHPEARIRSYREDVASIRIRIIDPEFRGLDRAERHDLIWGFLESLPEDTLSELTILLLLTPEEARKSIANMDFENPLP